MKLIPNNVASFLARKPKRLPVDVESVERTASAALDEFVGRSLFDNLSPVAELAQRLVGARHADPSLPILHAFAQERPQPTGDFAARRRGNCFELSQAFAGELRASGLQAGVTLAKRKRGHGYTHGAVLVRTPGSRQPLLLDPALGPEAMMGARNSGRDFWGEGLSSVGRRTIRGKRQVHMYQGGALWCRFPLDKAASDIAPAFTHTLASKAPLALVRFNTAQAGQTGPRGILWVDPSHREVRLEGTDVRQRTWTWSAIREGTWQATDEDLEPFASLPCASPLTAEDVRQRVQAIVANWSLLEELYTASAPSWRDRLAFSKQGR